MKAFKHSKISVKLHALLMAIPIFQQHPDKICLVDWLLKEIDRLSYLNDRREGWAFVAGKYLHSQFGGAYVPYINALSSLGLLEIDYHYEVGNHPRAYRLTSNGLVIVHESLRDYLKALQIDPQLRRAIQMSVVSRKVMRKSYGDPVLNYIHDGLVNTSFDLARIDAVMDDIAERISEEGKREGMNATETQVRVMRSQNHACHILAAYAEKRFEALKYNDSDARLWNHYAALSSAFRGLATYRQANGFELQRIACIDIRACHPTFWSSHILKCAESMALAPEDRANLLTEHQSWVAQFTGTQDPRQRIAHETGIPYAKVKSQLNKTINGYRKATKILSWLKVSYPTLFKVWSLTNVKQTGPAISKHFESRITLNPELYSFFESLGGCKAFYEYDGFSLFFSPDDKDSAAKVQKIVEKIQQLSSRQFGFKVVLKSECFHATPEDRTMPEDRTTPEVTENGFAVFARQQITEYKNLVASVSPLLVNAPPVGKNLAIQHYERYRN